MSVHTERAFELPTEVTSTLRWQNDANGFDVNDSTFSNCNLTASETGLQVFGSQNGGPQRAFIGIEMDWEITATNFKVSVINQTNGEENLSQIDFATRSRRTEQFFFTPSKRGSEALQGKSGLRVVRIFGSSNSGVHIHEIRFITAPRGEMAAVEGGA